MFSLQERLSEFSYGYGVTRQIEAAISATGTRTIPFLPSLIHEKNLGFDVSFQLNGAFLFVQFKLGFELSRYVRRASEMGSPPPKLKTPFWRFSIDTADIDGQFQRLLASENAGADVYYIAPRFSDWEQYASAYHDDQLVERSILLTPSDIDNRLSAAGYSPGKHQIMYDDVSVFVRSKPIELGQQTLDGLIRKTLRTSDRLDQATGSQFEAWQTGSSLLRKQDPDFPDQDRSDTDRRTSSDELFAKYMERSNDAPRSQAATIGMQAWSMGIQMFLLGEPIKDIID